MKITGIIYCESDTFLEDRLWWALGNFKGEVSSVCVRDPGFAGQTRFGTMHIIFDLGQEPWT